MGSVGSHEHAHAHSYHDEEMGIFKPEMNVGPPVGLGVALGVGYEWNHGQSTNWAPTGAAGMMSRVREERYETSPEKREHVSNLWPSYTPSATAAFARC